MKIDIQLINATGQIVGQENVFIANVIKPKQKQKVETRIKIDQTDARSLTVKTTLLSLSAAEKI